MIQTITYSTMFWFTCVFSTHTHTAAWGKCVRLWQWCIAAIKPWNCGHRLYESTPHCDSLPPLQHAEAQIVYNYHHKNKKRMNVRQCTTSDCNWSAFIIGKGRATGKRERRGLGYKESDKRGFKGRRMWRKRKIQNVLKRKIWHLSAALNA